MLRSSDPDVARAGARLAGLAALHHEPATDIAREAADGNAPHRRGLAEVAAANVALEDCRAWCEERLTIFINDTDEQLRTEAAASFGQLRHDCLEGYEALIIAFTDSMSYHDDSMSVLHLLENSLRRLPEITCVVSEELLDRFSDEVRDMRTSRLGDAQTVTLLVFRRYHQHLEDDWTRPALALIDRLCVKASTTRERSSTRLGGRAYDVRGLDSSHCT